MPKELSLYFRMPGEIATYIDAYGMKQKRSRKPPKKLRGHL
jgi:hypothetical protein